MVYTLICDGCGMMFGCKASNTERECTGCILRPVFGINCMLTLFGVKSKAYGTCPECLEENKDGQD